MDIMVNTPLLATPLTEPLHQLEQHILEQQTEIESWFRRQWRHTPAPIYSSVDLRNAGFKLAPIDTNLFPAGFNNLNPDFMTLCIQAMQSTLTQRYPNLEKILLIPESHTRNAFYLDNVAILCDLLECAGFVVKLGSFLSDEQLPLNLTTASGRTLTLHAVQQQHNQVQSGNFIPDLIFLNNDLSEAHPAMLDHTPQPIVPDLRLGWKQRLKSVHFSHYNKVANEFSDLIKIDPWWINPYFRNCGSVDFMQGDGLECLHHNATLLFELIQKKYDEYHIKDKPFIIVKADAGSYGMGVMSIKSPDELRTLNRKQRSHMAMTKGKVAINKVILQEGVYTFEKWNNATAEPVVYMIGDTVVGGFYRVNTQRGDSENLNAPGMHFQPLAFDESCQAPGHTLCEESHRRFYVYGVIARLAALASAHELQTLLGASHD